MCRPKQNPKANTLNPRPKLCTLSPEPVSMSQIAGFLNRLLGLTVCRVSTFRVRIGFGDAERQDLGGTVMVTGPQEQFRVPFSTPKY